MFKTETLMPEHAVSLLAAEAAHHLGVSIKALRLYEERGLLQPARTDAGYRRYSTHDLQAARDVVALRALGLSLGQIERIVKGEAGATDQALALREAELVVQFAEIQRVSERLRELRHGLTNGRSPNAGELAEVINAHRAAITFALPWPWGGEQFTFNIVEPLTYLVGPLGSGKTLLARILSQALPNAKFIDLQRLENPDQFERDLGLSPKEVAMVEQQLEYMRDEGAVNEVPVRLLLSAIEANEGQQTLIIEMIEDGLARPSQEALMVVLRRRLKTRAAPVIAMTRSSSILDLLHAGPGEAVLYCPANHSTPYFVPPFAGAAGYEALVSCLATPEVRERVARMKA